MSIYRKGSYPYCNNADDHFREGERDQGRGYRDPSHYYGMDDCSEAYREGYRAAEREEDRRREEREEEEAAERRAERRAQQRQWEEEQSYLYDNMSEE